ncbi:hypothetical protein SAVCW2_13160 [Streptomyces avermitilis]|nr:hypothetical protein SAVCW2_13160 [Streptomyces avermitilis]
MPPTSLSASCARARAGSPSALVARSTDVAALTTVDANSAATAVPAKAGRCARRAARARPVVMGPGWRDEWILRHGERPRADRGAAPAPGWGKPHLRGLSAGHPRG